MRKTFVTKVSDRGQVSIPADIRAELGIFPGSSVRWEMAEDGAAQIRLQAEVTKRKSALELIGFAKRFRPLRRTEEWFK